MVSNSVYMSSFPVIQTVLFCFSQTETFVGSDVILENYREKKTKKHDQLRLPVKVRTGWSVSFTKGFLLLTQSVQELHAS